MSAAVLAAALTVAPFAAVATPAVAVDASQAHPATSLVGYMPSKYEGRYYRKSEEAFRRCVIVRESEGHYRSANVLGDSWGAYQLTRALGIGAGWMMQPELIRTLGKAKGRALGAWLRSHPVTSWNRAEQDQAFYTILNWRAYGSGAKHWAGGRWTCTLAGAR